MSLGKFLRHPRFRLNSRFWPERERQRWADGGGEGCEVILTLEDVENVVAHMRLLLAHFEMHSYTLMTGIQFQNLRELHPGLLELLKTEVPKAHHIRLIHAESAAA